jgi:hypothetical protein
MNSTARSAATPKPHAGCTDLREDDPDHAARSVDDRPAGVSRVDGGIRLKMPKPAIGVPTVGGDPTLVDARNRVHNLVAPAFNGQQFAIGESHDPDVVGDRRRGIDVGKRQDRAHRARNLEQRQVDVVVRRHHLRTDLALGIGAAVEHDHGLQDLGLGFPQLAAHRHRDPIRHDVGVGHDPPVLVDHESGAGHAKVRSGVVVIDFDEHGGVDGVPKRFVESLGCSGVVRCRRQRGDPTGDHEGGNFETMTHWRCLHIGRDIPSVRQPGARIKFWAPDC